jgi:hypothetical protein
MESTNEHIVLAPVHACCRAGEEVSYRSKEYARFPLERPKLAWKLVRMDTVFWSRQFRKGRGGWASGHPIL